MIIKICGMGDPDIMHQLAKLPVNMLGFIFYPKSPRFVVGKIDSAEIAKLPGNIERVGVFVNTESDEIHEMAESYFLTAIQLHGNESPEFCHELKAEGYNILKAFNITIENDYEAYAPYCDYFLFDTPSSQHGGTGQKFDWTLLEKYKGTTPFLISGGIGPDDVETLKQITHSKFAGIDINSKFELDPGIKNFNLIKQFLSSLPQNIMKEEFDIDNILLLANELLLSYNENSDNDICSVKNMFYGAAPILFQYAKQLRLNMTEAEGLLWNHLTRLRISGARFKRQHPILFFIADFYCHQAKLIIEIDGGYHKIPSQYEYDVSRDHEIESLGLKVLRFTNEEVICNTEKILHEIESEIKLRIK
jgi:phosphoribosylanthranilate isomerase